LLWEDAGPGNVKKTEKTNRTVIEFKKITVEKRNKRNFPKKQARKNIENYTDIFRMFCFAGKTCLNELITNTGKTDANSVRLFATLEPLVTWCVAKNGNNFFICI